MVLLVNGANLKETEMKIRAHLAAFHRDRDGIAARLREIKIPCSQSATHPLMLELAFKHGQNDIQPVEGCPSLSVGDVIELPGDVTGGTVLFRVMGSGFRRMGADEPILAPDRDSRRNLRRFGAFGIQLSIIRMRRKRLVTAVVPKGS